MTDRELNLRQADMARSLFRAISTVFSAEMHKDDKVYLIVQLSQYFYLSYQYFAILRKKDIHRANLISTKIATSKNNIISLIEKKLNYHCTYFLDKLFGKNNWSHVINDGSISYAN